MRGIWLGTETVSFSRRTLLHGVSKWVRKYVASLGERRRACRGLVLWPERKNQWEELRWGYNIRMDFQEIWGRRGLGWYFSRLRQVASFCEHVDDISSFTKFGEFFNWLRNGLFSRRTLLHVFRWILTNKVYWMSAKDKQIPDGSLAVTHVAKFWFFRSLICFLVLIAVDRNCDYVAFLFFRAKHHVSLCWIIRRIKQITKRSGQTNKQKELKGCTVAVDVATQQPSSFCWSYSCLLKRRPNNCHTQSRPLWASCWPSFRNFLQISLHFKIFRSQLFRILGVQASNPATAYPDWGTSCYSSAVQGKYQDDI